MELKNKKRPKLAVFSKITMAMALVIGFFFLPIFSQAAIRDTVTYQAKVTDANLLAPVDANYNMEFKIYDAASAGNLLWTETWNGGNQVAMEDGVFTVELNSICASWTGACASNGGVDWSSDSLFLEVGFDADGNGSFEEVFSPRKRFTSSPYAQMAARLDTADDINFSDNTDHSLQWNEVNDRTLTVENDDATAVANLAVEGQMQTGSFSSAPTALGNGAMYYNTTDNKLYMQENGSWVAVGSGSASGDAIWDADSDTGIQTEEGADDDTIRFDLGGATPIGDALTMNQTNGLVWNEAGDALDFRLEGDTEANLFFVDASADMVGIGESSPEFILDLISGMQIGDGTDTDQDLLTVDNGDILANRPNMNYEKDIFFSGLDGFVFNNPDGSNTMMANSEDSYAYMLANAQDNSYEVEFLASHNSDPTSYTNLYAHAFGLTPTSENPYLAFQQGANSRHYLDVITSGSNITDIIFNEDSYDANFRIEGDNNANLFFVDAGTDQIALGNNSPNAFLDISSDIADALRINPYGISAGNTGNLEFMELAANGSNYVGFKAPDNIAADVAWVLPNADGSNGDILRTDGSGNLSWISPGGTADSIWDADSDTGIQVEETADEDMIRFDIGNSSGTAYPNAMVIDSDGEVGISTDTPDYNLDVAGDVGVDGYIYHNDDSNSYMYFTPDRWQLYTGGRSMIDVQYSDSEVAINEGATQTDFRVEGGTDDHLLFTDGSADNVGIGESAPDTNAKLEIAGNVMMDDYLYFQNTTTDYMRFDGSDFIFTNDILPSSDETYNLGSSTARWNKAYLGGNSLHIGDDGNDSDISYDNVNNNLVINDGAESIGLRIESSADPNMFYVDAINNRLGVGTNTPGAMMEINGGELWLYNDGNDPRFVIGDTGTSGDYGYLQWDSVNDYFRIEKNGVNGMKVNDNYVSIGNLYPDQPLKVANGSTELFRINTSGQVGINTSTLTASFEITPSTANALRVNPYGINAGNTGNLEFMELAANGSNYVAFKAPDNIAADISWVLPNADGGSGEVLSTDGSGNLSWTDSVKALWDADSDTGIQVEKGADDDVIRFDAGTGSVDLLRVSEARGFDWSPSNTASDFRVRGLTDDELIFADVSVDNVGIGEGAPDVNAKLEVAGNFMLDDYVYFNNTTTDYLRHDGTTFVMSDDFLPATDDTYDFGSSTVRWNDQFMGGTLSLGADGDDYDISFDETNNTLRFNDGGEANDVIIEGDTSSYLLFVDGVNDQVGVNLPSTQPYFDSSFAVCNEVDDHVMRIGGPDGDYHHGAKLRFGDADYVYLDEYADDNLMMYAAGNLYLDSNYGQVYMPDAYNNSITGRDLYVASTGEVGYRASSIRYKENVLDMENIDWLYDLRPVNFNYKDQTKEVYNKETGQMETVTVEVDHSKQYGLIAEEVEEINPEIVSYDSDGLVETVNYSYLMTPLLKAVQENKAAVDPILERIKVIDNGLEIEKGEASSEEQDVLVLHNEGTGAGIHVVQNGDNNSLGHGAAIYISGSKDSEAGDNNGIADNSDRYGLYINSEESDGEQKLFGIESDAGKPKDKETFYVRADGVTKVYADNKAPDRNEDGEFGFAAAGQQGRLYFQVKGKDYYINNSGTGDFSEYIASSDPTLHQDWGTIVSVDTTLDEAKVKRSSEMRDKNVLGVVSEFGTRNNDNDAGTRHENPEYVNVALMGQVPAKVTIQNGIIEAGDYLTTSLVYGHAMKADIGDPVIGIALETFTGNATSNEGMIDVLLSRNTNGNISALLAELQEKKSLSKEEVLDVIMNENLVANYLVMTKGEVMAGLKVHGELALDKQNIGEVIMPAGETSLTVSFPTHFSKKPVVTVTPHLQEDNDIFFNFQYLLVNITPSSFTIKLNQPLSYDLHFNWQAFAVSDYTDDFTVAEQPSQVSQKVDSGSNVNSVHCSLDNLSACVTAHDCWQYSDQAMWDGNACVLKESGF